MFLQIDNFAFAVSDIKWWVEYEEKYTEEKRIRIKLRDGSDTILKDEERIQKFKETISQFVIVI